MKSKGNQGFLFKIIENINLINYQIVSRKINSIIQVKKLYLGLKNEIDKKLSNKVSDDEKATLTDLKSELEKLYSVSIAIYKSYYWGEFSHLNNKHYPELYSMMVDKNGDLYRVFDNFKGTIAMMDFHGYTKFTNEVKYNKTPLVEFGNILPKKLVAICRKCRVLVYEMEGDALILIGPENPHNVLTAVFSIIELVQQKPVSKKMNPKNFHGIEIKNPMIKPFEMTAAVTTSGETFINSKGKLIGGIISEASRILSILNKKKPTKTGVMISDKVHRSLEKYRDKNTLDYLNVFSFPFSEPFIIDVKGMRLKIREIYFKQNDYEIAAQDYLNELTKYVKIKNPSKWYNILIAYTKLIITALKTVRVQINIDGITFNNDKFITLLDKSLAQFIKEPGVEVMKELTRHIEILYETSEEIKDVATLYHNYVIGNFKLITEKLESFYNNILSEEKKKNRNLQNALLSAEKEQDKLKNRYMPRRIMETILSDESFSKKIIDTPYIGKK